MALMGASGVVQAKAAQDQADAQSAQYNAQAAQADANKRQADRQAAQVADQYADKQREISDKRRLIAGQATASAGASGLTLEGSPLDILGSSYDAYKQDSQKLLTNQRNDTYDLYVQGHDYQQQANQYRAAASNAQSQGRLAAFSSILGTAASMSSYNNLYGKTNKQLKLNPTG